MVNFNDPARLARDNSTVVKLWHAADGLFIWEFITTLDYEWSVIRGRRPYRWTIWVHSLTRVAGLLAVILNMIGLDTASPINCQAWMTSLAILAYTAVAAASMLIVLRTIAIWNRNKMVSTIVICMWWTNVSFLIHSKSITQIAKDTVQIRSSWDPAFGACSVLNTNSFKYNIPISLSTDLVLFFTMLVGLFRLRLGVGTFGLGGFLWTQGVIWFLLATMAQLPPAVFILLDLSPPWNLMFQDPAMVTLIIAATRMYRALTDFCSPDISLDIPRTYVVSSTQPISPGSFPLNRVEMDKHTNSGQTRGSRADHYGLYVRTDTNVCEKPYELGNEGDMESGRNNIMKSG